AWCRAGVRERVAARGLSVREVRVGGRGGAVERGRADHARRRQDEKTAERLVVGGDELLDDGCDLLAPLAAVEDAVMADLPGEEILLLRLGQPGRDLQRGTGLADARNIVPLA